MLRNTPGTKIHRLARYANLTEEEIKSGKVIYEADQKAFEGMSETLTVPEYFNEQWWSKTSEAMDLLRLQLPIESLPVLLEAVLKWSDKGWTSYWVEEAVLLMEEYFKIHNFTAEQKGQVRKTLQDFVSKKSGESDFAESLKYANRLIEKIH